MSEITRRPTRSGTAMALSAAGLATFALAFTTATAAIGGLVGTLVIAAGLVRGSRRILDAAGGVFFLALVVAGVGGTGMEALLLATVASVLAWDTAENALSVGDHLGRESETTRLEVVHAATTVVVLVVGVSVVYTIWSVGSGGQPIAAVVLLLVGATAIVAAVRR